MLEEKDLQAIAEMMSQLKNEILTETTTNMNVLVENVVTPQFNLLAENQREILEKLVPRSRVDDLEDEVKFLKSIVRRMDEDLQQLKKAN